MKETRTFRSRRNGDIETFSGPPWPHADTWECIGWELAVAEPSSSPRTDARRQQLLQEQQRLAEIERAKSAETHAVRSKLDAIACKLDRLPPTRISPKAAFDYVLEHLRVSPQKPIAAHGGWSSAELTAIREVYAVTQADRIVVARELVGRPIDADTPTLEELANRAQSSNDLDPRIATVERIMAAKLRAEGKLDIPTDPPPPKKGTVASVEMVLNAMKKARGE
jgi:hypothetical protein